MNLMMLLEMASSGFPDRVAVTSGTTSLTYSELFLAVGNAAAGLGRTACRHVAVLDTNCLAVPVALFASAWAGLPFVPLNYRLTGSELEGLLDRIAPAYLVTDAGHARVLSKPARAGGERNRALSEQAPPGGDRYGPQPADYGGVKGSNAEAYSDAFAPGPGAAGQAPGDRGPRRRREPRSTAPVPGQGRAALESGTRIVEREQFLAQALHAQRKRDGSWPMDPERTAVLLFTSGTTGAPKAAVLRHKNIVSYILGSVEFGCAGADEAALLSVPPYHVAATAAILSSVYAGRRIVQLPTFSAEGWLSLAHAQGITHAFVVPTMLKRIIDVLESVPGSAPPTTLCALSYGGGKMPLPVIEKAMRLFPGTDFTNAYGLTETSSTITVLGPDEHREAAASDNPALRRRLGSVGRALPDIELQVRDPAGNVLGPGCSGEIYVRGAQVSGEYVGREAALDGAGWFATRDGGWIDEQGYLFVEGRMDDVIVRGGENLSPAEIEDVLLEHEAVCDCAVVAVPDEQWGEAVAAVVVLREGCSVTADELREWVRLHLRSSRTPARIEFWAGLPYNETGKLLRRAVRARLLGETS